MTLMKINVKVVPNARKNMVKEEPGLLKVYTTAPALEGKANKAVLNAVAEHWGVKAAHVAMIKGLKSRNKVIMIKI